MRGAARGAQCRHGLWARIATAIVCALAVTAAPAEATPPAQKQYYIPPPSATGSGASHVKPESQRAGQAPGGAHRSHGSGDSAAPAPGSSGGSSDVAVLILIAGFGAIAAAG